MKMWEQAKTHDGETIVQMDELGYAVPLMVPVEMSEVEKAALENPYVLPSDEPDMVRCLVPYDEQALLGLWIENDTGLRFLVTSTKDIGDEPYFAIGLREFQARVNARREFEPFSAAIRNMRYWYHRADGRVCTHPEYLKSA